MSDMQLCREEYWEKKRAELTADDLAGLRREADRCLASPGFSVVFKEAPALSGDPHDYVSLSIYDWPNPDTPDGMPWIHRDGVINPDWAKYDSPSLGAMCRSVGTLSAAGKLTGETRYCEKAGRLLKCWFLDPETAMTPHLNFAQFIPGRAKGNPWGLIDSHPFCELFEAAGSLPFNPEWTPGELERLRQWATKYFLWLISDPSPVKEERAPGNHGTWYDAQFVALALFLGYPDLARRQIREKSIPRLSTQLLNNGQQPFEIARTLSLSYSIFNLTAWSKLAAYAKLLGMELWVLPSDDQATLRNAFHYLLPYLTGKAEWEFLQAGPMPAADRLLSLVDDFLEPVDAKFRPCFGCICPGT